MSGGPTTFDNATSRQGRRATLVGEKINDISNMITGTDKESELPMYKDKPYNYAPSQRRIPVYRRPRLIALLVFAVLCGLYFSGGSPTLRPPPVPDNVREAWKASQLSKPFSNFLTDSKLPTTNWNDRRDRVRDAFKISWAAYEQHGWGLDEYHPLSQTGRQMVPNGMGWIIVDALDTMMIMNLTTELSHARDWIQSSLNYDQDHDVSVFETTIRMLGGLLSAHYLSTTFPDLAPVPPVRSASNDDLYLEIATDLADRLLGAYESRSGIPYASVNLHTRAGIPSHADAGASSTAEASTLQLEMKYLAKLTGETNYWEKAEKIMQVLDDRGMKDGLLPIFLQPDTALFQGNNIRLGSRGDSYYEYLIKQYLQTSEQEPVYGEMWDDAVMGIRKHLITYTKGSNLTILGERPQGLNAPVFPKMDHLVCFMPGTIALGATKGRTLEEARMSPTWSERQEEEIELARQLTKTCWGFYLVTATGLSPEISHFRLQDPPVFMQDLLNAGESLPTSPDQLSSTGSSQWRTDYDIHNQDFHNMQRPEFVETLFYMWRITGDIIYRDWGWQIFENFVAYTSVPNGGGFSSVNDVDKIPPPSRDNMESFWLAETLKYLYLLFSPSDLLPLEDVVFNTEAHPMPRFDMGKLFQTGWKRKPRDQNGNMIATPDSQQPQT
ncbi:MAG: hypothetical protein Q9162_006826 [Coniocarpon cinnabarinum]